MAKTITTPGTPHCPTITAILERSRFKRRYKIYQVILQHLLASSIIFFIVLLQCIHLGEEETEKTSFKSYYPVQISDTNIWYKYSIQISGTRIWYKYPMQIQKKNTWTFSRRDTSSRLPPYIPVPGRDGSATFSGSCKQPPRSGLMTNLPGDSVWNLEDRQSGNKNVEHIFVLLYQTFTDLPWWFISRSSSTLRLSM